MTIVVSSFNRWSCLQVYEKVCVTEGEIERETDTQRHRQTETERDRETERERKCKLYYY